MRSENELPLLLVHPVGIGLSSWFWDKFLDEWQGGEVTQHAHSVVCVDVRARMLACLRVCTCSLLYHGIISAPAKRGAPGRAGGDNLLAMLF